MLSEMWKQSNFECFRFQLLLKFYRFLTFGIFSFRFEPRIELVASSSLPLPVSFFKVLLLPLKFNRFHCFRFSLLSMKQLVVFSVKKQASLHCKLFHLTCVVDRAWYGLKDDFSILHTAYFLPFHFHSILQIFHSILKLSSIFHSILP